MVKKVAVVGAGVVGLSTASHLAERFRGSGVTITVIADRFSPNTTSDKSGSYILPIVIKLQSQSSPTKNVSDGRYEQWTLETFELLRTLYHSETAGEIGLSIVSSFSIVESSTPLPWWKDVVFGFRTLPIDSPEVQAVMKPPQSHDGRSVYAFSTYLLDCRSYLPWLMRKLVKSGVIIEKRKLSSLNELSGYYDIVINCSGLGAAELVGDTGIGPVRGQAVLVRAPWIKQSVISYRDGDEDMIYIFPRSQDVLLGGTAIGGNWSEEVDPATTDAIVARCTNLMPSLRGAEVIGAWVGGRPVRKSVRLEAEEVKQGKPLVIHNYGHGSQGVVIHWGCALEVGRILQQYIRGKLHSHL